MARVSPRELSERELHEYVADVEGHDSQVTGVVGYFYRMYRAEVLARVDGVHGRGVLEIGCGEGMMFDGTATSPVQMDVSFTRVARRQSLAASAFVRSVPPNVASPIVQRSLPRRRPSTARRRGNITSRRGRARSCSSITSPRARR